MIFDSLAQHINVIQDTMQRQVAHAINRGLTVRNWLIGCYIVEFEQHGEDRAAYGEQLLKRLEQRINKKGLTERRFREFRKVYLTYPQLVAPVMEYLDVHAVEIRRTLAAELEQANPALMPAESTEVVVSGENQIRRAVTAELQTIETGGVLSPLDPFKIFNRLSYTHMIRLSKIEHPLKRAFYEVETIAGCWTDRELERQINTLYYERSGFSGDKAKLSALINRNAEALEPVDIVGNPVALEFLGLPENTDISEDELENAILDNVLMFLQELGRGFCLEYRQKRLLIDDDYFKVDLVFYHRILKCHVLVDLKIDKFKHEYASQMNMYLNYYKHEVMQADDNPPVGIILCSDKGEMQVKYATAGLNPNIFVSKYMLQLPTEEDIRKYIMSKSRTI